MLTKEASKTVFHVFKDRFLVSRNDRNDNNSYFLDTPFLYMSNQGASMLYKSCSYL